jgi:signal transduction histidine kinase
LIGQGFRYEKVVGRHRARARDFLLRQGIMIAPSAIPPRVPGPGREPRSRFTSISVLLQAVIGVMASVLVAAFSVSAFYAYQREYAAVRVLDIADVTRDIFDAMKYLRIERGTVSTALAAPEPATPQTLREIAALRANADAAFAAATDKIDSDNFSGGARELDAIHKAAATLARIRRAADAALLLPREKRPTELGAQWVAANNTLVEEVDDLSETLPDRSLQPDPFVEEMMSFKRLAWLTSDSAGMDRLILGVAIANNAGLSPSQREQIANQSGRIVTPWRLIKNEVRLGHAPDELARAVRTADQIYFHDICKVRLSIIAALAAGKPSPVSDRDWLAMSKAGLDHVLGVAHTAVDLAAAHAESDTEVARRLYFASLLGVVLFVGFGVFAIVFVARQVVEPMAEITRTMRLVAEGNLGVGVPFQDRGDEIGDLARALGVFKANAIEKKQIELELIKSKETAESSNRAKSQFLANMSHELRTPLNAVIGFAEMMSAETFGPLGSPRYQEYADAIRGSGAHLLALINDILDLSRLDAGQADLIDEELDVEEITETSLTMIAGQAKAANIEVSRQVAPNLPLLRADRRRVKQVLINLLANAVKFTPAGGRVSLSAALSKDGGLTLAVADTGIGIAKEDIPKALERFGQVDSKLSRRYEGAGLGLPLAKQLMELHGGTLVLESELNVGTTVRVTFPHERLVQRAKGVAA